LKSKLKITMSAAGSADADEELWGSDDPEIYDDSVEVGPDDVAAP
jgi:hypothetical protein